MCDVLDRAEMRGRQQGMQQGMQQAKREALLSLMKNMNWSPIQAMDALSIPDSDRSKYSDLFNQ